MRWVYVSNTRLCLHKDAQASHFFSAKTSRVPLPFNSPPARPHGCSRGTSRSSTNVAGPFVRGPLLTLSPVGHRMWTFLLTFTAAASSSRSGQKRYMNNKLLSTELCFRTRDWLRSR